MELESLILPLKTEDNAFRAGISRAIQLVQGAATAVGQFWSSGIEDIKEAQDAIAQMDAVIQSTGGKAGVTREELVNMADAFERTTKFSAETTMAGQNLLLTFTNIGSKVFPQATKTILDMSQALGQDTKASAIQLGKALNDPIRGVSALRKVGVSFTEDQEKLIKSLVETGKVEEAQALILNELQTEFGGSAEAAGKTFGGHLEILKNNLGAIREEIVGYTIPALSSMAQTANDEISKVRDILAGPGTLAEKATAIFKEADNFIGGIIDSFATSIDDWVASGGPEELSGKIISWIENIGTGDQSKILTAAGHLVTAIATALGDVDWAGVAEAIDTKLAETFDNVDWAGAGHSLAGAIDYVFSGAWIDSLKNLDATIPDSIQSLLNGINEFFLAAVGADQFGGWNAYFTVWGAQIQAQWNATIENWKINISNFFVNAWNSLAQKTSEFFTNWKNSWTTKVHEWGAAIRDAVIAQVNKIISAINSIPLLPDIPKIPTSQNKNVSNVARASGGAVIAGQSYNVAEFYKPEVFTPSVNGRIDPIGARTGSNVSEISDESMDKFFNRFALELQKIGN